MTILEERVEALERGQDHTDEVLKEQVKALKRIDKRFADVERHLRHLERQITMLGGFLKRRLDPDDSDEWRPQ